MTYTKAVAMRTAQLLIERGYSKYAFRRMIGMSKSTFDDIMLEKTKDIRMSTVEIIASGFGMTIEQFCGHKLFGEKLGGDK